METADRAIASLDVIAEEHESLANLYAQILHTLEAAPRQALPAMSLLDDLVERLLDHFAHEEQGGYYSHIVELCPGERPRSMSSSDSTPSCSGSSCGLPEWRN